MKPNRGIMIHCLILLVAVFFISAVRADQVRPMNLEQIVQSAEVIFEGECTEVRSGKDPDTGLMATWYTFQVTRGIKGKLDETFVLKQFGGSDGNSQMQGVRVHYEPGEEVILFLYGTSQLGFSSAVGLSLGKFTVQEIPETKTRYVTNGMPAMLLYENMSSTPMVLNAQGMQATGLDRLRSERLELNNFLDQVRLIIQTEDAKKKSTTQE